MSQAEEPDFDGIAKAIVRDQIGLEPSSIKISRVVDTLRQVASQARASCNEEISALKKDRERLRDALISQINWCEGDDYCFCDEWCDQNGEHEEWCKRACVALGKEDQPNANS